MVKFDTDHTAFECNVKDNDGPDYSISRDDDSEDHCNHQQACVHDKLIHHP